jgi:F-type H+-transporting ATPase subunit a
VLSLLTAVDSEGNYKPPTILEFYPPAFLFEGTPFEMNRIMMVRVIVMVALIVLFWLWTRRFNKSVKAGVVVPGRFQLLGELSLNFVRKNIAHDQLGEKDGDRFLPLLTTIFFVILGMNLTGLIPGFNIAGTSVVGLPLVLAAAAYFTFIYAGMKRHGFGFFKNALFPSGVPPVMYIMVTPIEFLSTFILRPVTLALRLLMNMVAGHLLLVLLFGSTHFFFFSADGLFKLFGVGTLAFGFAFTLFKLLVAVLQAYVFTLLTTVYIQLALADEH